MAMKTDAHDNDLDRLFQGARIDGPDLSPALLERILGDAAELQPRPPSLAVTAPSGPGFWSGLLAAFGGAGMLAGLGTAAVAGLMIGLFPPAPINALAESLFQAPLDEIELLPGVDALFSEG